jgi:MFS family permease
MNDAFSAKSTTGAGLPGMPREFARVWLNQLLSLTGSALTGFGIAVWVYQQTGSVLHYSLLLACVAAPPLFVAPWAGAWVDRMDRRLVMIVADSGAALCTAAIGLLLWLSRLEVWQLLLFNALAAVCNAFQRPAFLATVTTLLPKSALGRAGGLIQLAFAAPTLIAPIAATVLLTAIGLKGIIVLDLACFAVATSLLLFVRFPRPVAAARPARSRRSARKEFAEVLDYFRQQPSLGLLLSYVGVQSFLIGLVMALFPPIVLAIHSGPALGTVFTFGGVGMLAGSLLMSVWRGPRRRVLGIMPWDMALGAAVVVGGVCTSVPMFIACAVVVMMCGSVINCCEQNLWRCKIAPAMQGRLFALREVVVNAALPLAAIVGGLAADHYFEPWMMSGGLLADSAGAWIGVGKGRGVGLMFVVVGALTIVLAIAALLHPAMRGLEDKVPDAH